MLVKNWNADMYVPVFNEMIDKDSERRLTAEELYVYVAISTSSGKDYSIKTSTNRIAYDMKTEFENSVRFAKKENNHKLKIREALIGLIKKGYLNEVYEVDLNSLRNETELTLELSEDIEYKFTKLYFMELKYFTSADNLLIFIVAKRFSYNNGFQGSFDCWADLLNVTAKTAQKRLNEAEFKVKVEKNEKGQKIEKRTGVVHIARGRYTDLTNQEVNLYKHVDFMAKEKKVEENEESQPSNANRTGHKEANPF